MSRYVLTALLACETINAQSTPSTTTNNQSAMGTKISSSSAGTNPSSPRSHSTKSRTQSGAVKSSSLRQRHRSNTNTPGPVSPTDLPASPPEISYLNGQLTVVANNSTLSDVLKGIQNTTGAKIEGVTPTDSDRIFGEFGPASPHEVCDKLLNGSHYDFILLGAPEEPNSVQRIILTERSTETTSSPAAPSPQPATAENADDSQEMSESDTAANNSEVETPNQPQMTPEQQQILPQPADSAQAQTPADGQPSQPQQQPTHPQHWGVHYPGSQPAPQQTDVQPH